jgi:AraC-like DNA-binding protein
MLAPLLKEPDAQDLRVVRGESVLIKLLQDHLWSLFRLAPRMNGDDVSALTAPTLDLVAAAINGTVAEERASGVTTCLADGICRYVRMHLMDRDLSPDKIAAQFGISSRKLSYLFEDTGGISAYIQLQRLHLARRTLADPAQRDKTIADLAERFGFSHRPSITRAFERVHGMSPRQVRALALANKTVGQDGASSSWHEWIREPHGE